MTALALTATWPVAHCAAAVVRSDRPLDTIGDTHWVFRIASISKMLVGWTALVAFEEGSIDLDESLEKIGTVDVRGITPRHLLAHTAGFAFDTLDRVAPIGARRVYSNTGIDLFADHLSERTAMPFADYLREAVLEPLSMTATTLRGSAAKDVRSTVADLVMFASELMAPRLVSSASAREFRTTQFPGVPGVVPGVGRYDDCAWGLGTEVRGTKSPHWTGTRNSPATFGHFGGAGTLLWVDPVAATSCVALTDRPFDEWSNDALRLWPELSDAILAETSAGASQ